MLYKDYLANGIRVITEEIPFVHSVSIGIWVGTGSRYEEASNHGISHLLEHMMFKGTKNRTAKQIAESLEIVGGQINAFTSKEYTCYYAKVLSDHFDLALDVLADMFLNSLFTSEDVAKEKNVILEEIKMYEDTPDELVHDVYSKTVWKQDPLGDSIIGTSESVGKISREQLISYYQDHYIPQNVVIAVAGNIKHDLVLKSAEVLFSKLKGTKVPKTLSIPEAFTENAFVFKKVEQMHLCLGFPGIPSLDEDIYALTVLNNVLGGGLSSRLFQEVREERGLSYSIYSFHSGFSNSGLFGIYAGTSVQCASEVIDIILEQIHDIKNRGITKEELSNTKEQIKGTMLLSLENVSNRMNRIGKSEICYDRIITVEEVIDKMLQVTNEDVYKIANKLFVMEKLAIAVVGAEKPQLNLKHLTQPVN